MPELNESSDKFIKQFTSAQKNALYLMPTKHFWVQIRDRFAQFSWD